MRDDIHFTDGGQDGRDARVAAALRSLDPGSDDPGYWFRFHSAVMARARDQLARRRMLADVTVGDLMASWARMVVPTAVLAAVLASLLLLRPGASPDATGQDVPVALEELLREELGERAGSEVEVTDRTMGVTFASGSF